MSSEILTGKLEGVIANLAESFGTTVPHLYQVLTNHAYVKALQAGMFFLLVVLLWYLFIIINKKKERFNLFFDDNEAIDVFNFISSIIISLASIISLIWMIDAFSMLLNPEKYAIDQLMKFF